MKFPHYFNKYNRMHREQHKSERERLYKIRELQIQNKIEYDKTNREIRMLRRELNYYWRQNDTQKAEEIRNNILKLEENLNDIHIKKHLINSRDFNHYYRHIRFTRPIVLIFNLFLWFLLFTFGGVQTGLKIVILIFAIFTTSGSIFEMLFLLRIRERILKPIDNLKNGVNEIASGNYSVHVEAGTTNEVGSLIEAFNKMAQKLNDAEILKTEYEENRKALIANISHDLKTPITSVQGYIEAISEQNDLSSEKLNKYLKIIYSNTAYMNKLIDDLFLFSKLDMQKLDFHFEETAIRPFFNDLMEEMRLDLEEKNVSFNFSDELSDECIVNLDPKRFYQILRNLIDNAVKYGPSEGLEIKSRLHQSEKNIYIDLCDNGYGIEEDQLKNIFKRFYRVDTERTKDFSSTGLGLAIAKELAEAHGGDITVQSAKGVGTCFIVAIPHIDKR